MFFANENEQNCIFLVLKNSVVDNNNFINMGVKKPGTQYKGKHVLNQKDEVITWSLGSLSRKGSKEAYEFYNLEKVALEKAGVLFVENRILDSLEVLDAVAEFGIKLLTPVLERCSTLSYIIADYIHRKVSKHSGYENSFRVSLNLLEQCREEGKVELKVEMHHKECDGIPELMKMYSVYRWYNAKVLKMKMVQICLLTGHSKNDLSLEVSKVGDTDYLHPTMLDSSWLEFEEYTMEISDELDVTFELSKECLFPALLDRSWLDYEEDMVELCVDGAVDDLSVLYKLVFILFYMLNSVLVLYEFDKLVLTQYAMNTVLPTLAVLGLHEYDKLLIAS